MEDLTGQTFNRLTVIGPSKKKGKNGYRHHWWCLCSCGELACVESYVLRKGIVKSCGCWKKEKASEFHFKHGGGGTKEYYTWWHMIDRCENPKSFRYEDWGGRDIFVCKRWKNSFELFLKDMGYCPEGLSLERINNNDGYYPENCKWATPKEQTHNRRGKGYYFNKEAQKWHAAIKRNNKTKHIGFYTSEKEARFNYLKTKKEIDGKLPPQEQHEIIEMET